MDIVRALEKFLFILSSGLYFPVVGAVSALCIYTLWLLGALLGDSLLRLRGESSQLNAYRKKLKLEIAHCGDHLDARLERLLQSAELDASRRLDRVRFVIKVGPALGLMGTLIPMGVSLASLAEGNIPENGGQHGHRVYGHGCRSRLRRRLLHHSALARKLGARRHPRNGVLDRSPCARSGHT